MTSNLNYHWESINSTAAVQIYFPIHQFGFCKACGSDATSRGQVTLQSATLEKICCQHFTDNWCGERVNRESTAVNSSRRACFHISHASPIMSITSPVPAPIAIVFSVFDIKESEKELRFTFKVISKDFDSAY